MPRNLALYITLVYFSVAAPAYAAHPLMTEDTGTQGKGNFQLEVNGDYTSFTDTTPTPSEKTTTTNIAATLSIGFTDTIDLMITAPYALATTYSGSTNGVGDLAFEVKLKIYEEGPLGFLLKPGLSLPAAHGDGISTGVLGVATLALAPFDIHLNAGYRASNKENTSHLSAAFLFAPVNKLKLVVNVAGDKGEAYDSSIAAVVGAIYYPTEKIDLDLGMKRGLNAAAATDYAAMAGMTVRW